MFTYLFNIHKVSHFLQILVITGMTTVVCLVLVLYSKQNRFPVTSLHLMVLSAVVIGIAALLLALTFGGDVEVFPATFFALIFSQYFVIETQLMLDGNHLRSVDPEEHVFAVLSMHLDIFALVVFGCKWLWAKIRCNASA